MTVISNCVFVRDSGECHIENEGMNRDFIVKDGRSKKLPKLHKDILLISPLNYTKIRKAYEQVLGLNAIDHLSINIVNPDGEMVFLSSTPATGQNVCGTDLWRHDFSIHPETYENKKFYWWDECYAQGMKKILKFEKETKNNLSCGFICTRKVEGFHLMYSFATREVDPGIRDNIKEYQSEFIHMGDHCYGLVRDIYERYSGGYHPPILNSSNFPKQVGRIGD